MVRAIAFDNFEFEKAKSVLQFLGLTYGKDEHGNVLVIPQEMTVSYLEIPGVKFTFNGSLTEMLNQAAAIQRDLVKSPAVQPKSMKKTG